ncbi:MAG: caspase family protein [Mesorhizobium sp.]
MIGCFAGTLRTAAAVIMLGAGTIEVVARENHALLVGVTRYDNLPQPDWLDGPANDAQLVRDYLLTNPVSPFKRENITLLASDVEGAAPPTRAAILAAFDDLAARADEGDFVFIQLSGHGSQQPAADIKTEIDGKDEIFLPMDIGKIDVATKMVPNAIVDDEIGDKLDAIRAKGAFVWIVIDACHSGTATRAFGSNARERERKISPASLGITPDMFPKVQATRSLDPDQDPERENALGMTDAAGNPGDRKGGMVAFFAAQTVETAPELPLPDTDPNAKVYGLLTYTMLERLAANPAVTYRQLSQAILQHYSALNRIKPTPLFEGALDAPVFGVEGDEPIMQWKIAVRDGIVQLPAGRLNRIEPGAKLAILPGPQSTMEDAIGFLDVRSATNMSSQLLPAAFRERSALRVDDIPANAYARVAEQAVSFQLAVARPDAAKHPKEAARLSAVLDTVSQDRKTPLKLKLVEPGEAADIRLAVASEAELGGDAAKTEPRLWFLPPSAEVSFSPGRRPPSLDLVEDKAMARDMGGYLVRISRATGLSRLAGASDGGLRNVKVEFLIERGATGKFETMEPGKVPVLAPDDSVYFKAENGSRRPVDINILHIGSDYKISFAEGYGDVTLPARMNEGDKIPETGLFTVDKGGHMGGERLIAVVSEAAPMSAKLDLSYLAQGGLRNLSKSAETGFAAMLGDIAAPPATRQMSGFKPNRTNDKGGDRGAVMIFPIETTGEAQ